MSKDLTVVQQNEIAIENALIAGDLGGLTIPQRLQYVKSVCKSVKLNPLTKPFDYIRFEGKVMLYINRGGAEQLRKIHNISIENVNREIAKDRELYTVIVKATTPKGRTEDGMGVVSIGGLRGKDLANALMKAETKAKRRATLALCGLSQFDSPSGEEEPIRQSNIEQRIEEVSAKAETTERPEFETVVTSEEREALTKTEETTETAGELPPAPPAPQGYICKGGRNKGKPLAFLPKSRLIKLVSTVDEWLAAGKPVHPDVQEDAQQAKEHLGRANG